MTSGGSDLGGAAAVDAPAGPESVTRALDDLPEVARFLAQRPWKILLIEDEPDHAAAVQAILKQPANVATIGAFDLVHAETVEAARALIRTHRFDLLIVDWALGEDSGLDLVMALPSERPRPPTIMLTSDTRLALALDSGADDYVHKAALAVELPPRIRARLRGHGGRQRLVYGRLEINFADNSISYGTSRVRLKQIQLTLLGYLAAREMWAARPGADLPAAASMAELLENVWRHNVRRWSDGEMRVNYPGSNVVDKTVSLLNTALKKAGVPVAIKSRPATIGLEEAEALPLSKDEDRHAVRELSRGWIFVPDGSLQAVFGSPPR